MKFKKTLQFLGSRGAREGPMGSQGGGPWDPMGGDPWEPMGAHGIPGWALGDPMALGNPLAHGDLGPWGPGPWARIFNMRGNTSLFIYLLIHLYKY